MPRLRSSKEIIFVLENNGFIFVSQKGSHGKYINSETKSVVIVPMNKKEIPLGTLASIVRQSKLDKNLF